MEFWSGWFLQAFMISPKQKCMLRQQLQYFLSAGVGNSDRQEDEGNKLQQKDGNN